jgi:hypothetical protein
MRLMSSCWVAIRAAASEVRPPVQAMTVLAGRSMKTSEPSETWRRKSM